MEIKKQSQYSKLEIIMLAEFGDVIQGGSIRSVNLFNIKDWTFNQLIKFLNLRFFFLYQNRISLKIKAWKNKIKYGNAEAVALQRKFKVEVYLFIIVKLCSNLSH